MYVSSASIISLQACCIQCFMNKSVFLIFHTTNIRIHHHNQFVYLILTISCMLGDINLWRDNINYMKDRLMKLILNCFNCSIQRHFICPIVNFDIFEGQNYKVCCKHFEYSSSISDPHQVYASYLPSVLTDLSTSCRRTFVDKFTHQYPLCYILIATPTLSN